MWVLIFAMYASPYTSSNVARLHTQKLDTETLCQIAVKQFE
ncbi:MAG: hypothetical protein ACL7BU_09305 [Candidatus Phlomobacter fragariae]